MLASLRGPKPMTLTGSASAVAAVDLNAAFDFVARDFFENYRLWQPQVIEMQPLGAATAQPGVKARETTFDRGMRSEWIFEIAEVDPPHRFVLAGLSEPMRLIYEFEGAGRGATEVTFGFEAQLALSMRPFADSIRASLQAGAEQTAGNLKRTLEAQREERLQVSDIWQAARKGFRVGAARH